MKIIDKPVTENNFLKLSFQGNVYEGKEIISVKELTIGYDKPLIKNLNFSLYGKDRIAIMGSNGCGKTTLLDALINHKHILNGEIKYVRNVNVGYIKQHQIDLNPDRTIFEEMQFNFPSLGEKTIYNYLGRFNFDYEDSSKKIAILSGGEKTRIVLAKIMLENYDVLVLDEPTNHLDMVTRQALILALQAYQGSIIFVSHDRYFVDELATHLIYVDHQTPYFIKGNFLDFKEQESKLLTISDELVEEKKIEKKVINKKPSLKLEEQIKKLEEEIKKVKEEQFLEENYMDYQKMQSLDKKLKELETNLAKLEEEYLQE